MTHFHMISIKYMSCVPLLYLIENDENCVITVIFSEILPLSLRTPSPLDTLPATGETRIVD